MTGKLRNRNGKISVFEMILIVCIAVMLLFLASKGFDWMADQTAHGNDSLLVNTALSEARINSNNGLNCVVQDCPSKNGGLCTHQVGDATIGYIDNVTKHIVGDRPYGYNQSTHMDIDDKVYYGDAGTMVIMVKAEQGNVTASWVPGKE